MSEDTWNFDYPQIARDSGFKFRQYNDGHIDWRQIGGIEVEKIIQNKNIEKLDTIINHLAEVPLGSLLDSNILESGIAKYFILSQLAIQYLVFCKRFLDETVTTMRTTLKEMHSEKMRYKKSEQERTDDILQLHKEIQKLRNIAEVIFPCSMCTKNFVSNEMLNIHISRKHANEIKRAAAIQQNNVSQSSTNSAEKRTKENDKNLISTIKLELEIKHLKERLNDAEKIIQNQTFEITKQIDEIKGSPRNYQFQESTSLKKESSVNTVAIQIEPVSTKTIGIQSNLSEEKETDDVDALDKKNILEIFNQINEKITKIEKVRNDDIKNREETLIKFENKLQNVTDSLEAKQQHNLEILNKFTDKMSSQTSLNQDGINVGEIKEFLNNAVEKIQSENKKQLHEIAEKFDQTLSDKINVLKKQKPERVDKLEDIVLNSSQDEIDKLIPSSSKSIKSIISEKKTPSKLSVISNDDIPKIIERNEISRIPINKNAQITNVQPKHKQMLQSKNSKITIEPIHNDETSQSSGEVTDSESSDSNSYSDDVTNVKKVMGSSSLVTPKLTDIKKQLIKDKLISKENTSPIKSNKKSKNFKEPTKNIVPPLRLTKSSINIPKLVQKMQENRLKTIGISPNAKLIASSSMPQISENLSNIRKDKRKFFPKFNSTRNHIKTLVDNIIRTKNVGKSENNNLQIPTTSYHSKSERKFISSEEDMLDVKTSEIIEENNSDFGTEDSYATNKTEDSEMKKSYLRPHSDVKQAIRDDFKLKLERVLSSPIHKVKKIPSNEHLLLRTPVPTPRKKVMFDFPIKSTNENDYSFREDEFDEKDY